jgi:bifunctional DNA-binding transcriptional regulator/antitoxin component of YhaV-PrlF toxin-antitoxin module
MTVPLAVRKALGLRPGAKLEISLRGDAEFVVSKAIEENFFLRFKGIRQKKAPFKSGDAALEQLRGSVAASDAKKR